MAICGQGSLVFYRNPSGHHEPCPCRTVSSVTDVCVHLSLRLLRPPSSLRHNSVGVKPVHDTPVALKWSGERQSQLSLNREPRHGGARLLAPAGRAEKAQGERLKGTASATPVSAQAEGRPAASWPMRRSSSDLDRRSDQAPHGLMPKPDPQQGPNSLQFLEG